MTREQARREILSILGGIAPEVDLAAIDPGADLREEADLDSMDFLRVLVLVHERLGVDVPEGEYARVRTLDALAAWVAERAGGRAGDPAPAP